MNNFIANFSCYLIFHYISKSLEINRCVTMMFALSILTRLGYPTRTAVTFSYILTYLLHAAHTIFNVNVSCNC
jgi:hypothetical protein